MNTTQKGRITLNKIFQSHLQLLRK